MRRAVSAIVLAAWLVMFAACSPSSTSGPAKAGADRPASIPASSPDEPVYRPTAAENLQRVLHHADRAFLTPKAKKLLIRDSNDRTCLIDIASGDCQAIELPASRFRGQSYVNDDGKVTFVCFDGKINGQDKGLPVLSNVVFYDLGAKFAATTPAGKVMLVDAADGKVLKEFKVPFEPARLEASRDGGALLVHKWINKPGPDAIHIDAATGAKNEVKFGNATGRSLSPDGKTVLLSTFNPGRIELWGVAQGKVITSIEKKHSTAMFAGNGDVLVMTADGVERMDSALDHTIGKIGLKYGGLYGWAMSEDGKAVFAKCGKVGVWDMESGRPLLVTDSDRPSDFVAFAFGSDRIYAADGAGVLWQWRFGQERAEPMNKPTGSSPGQLLLTPDGPRFVHMWKDGKLEIEAPDGKTVRSIKTESGSAMPNQRVLSADCAIMAMSDLKAVLVYDGRSGNQIGEVPIHDKAPVNMSTVNPLPLTPMSLAISPDNKYVAAGNTILALYDLPSGSRKPAIQFKLAGPAIWRPLWFSPNGRMIALHCGKPEVLRIYDTATGEEIASFPEGQSFAGFSPQSNRIALAGQDGAIAIRKIKRTFAATTRPEQEAIAGLWKKLASADPAVAYSAMNALVAAGGEAVSSQPLEPTPPGDAPRTADLFRQLDDDDSKVRDAASRKLEALGLVVLEDARKEHDSTKSAEVRIRLEDVMQKLNSTTLGKDDLRATRVIRVLEMIGDRQAREILAKLAAGGPSRQTIDAAIALERLKAGR